MSIIKNLFYAIEDVATVVGVGVYFGIAELGCSAVKTGSKTVDSIRARIKENYSEDEETEEIEIVDPELLLTEEQKEANVRREDYAAFNIQHDVQFYDREKMRLEIITADMKDKMQYVIDQVAATNIASEDLIKDLTSRMQRHQFVWNDLLVYYRYSDEFIKELNSQLNFDVLNLRLDTLGLERVNQNSGIYYSNV